MTRPLFLAFQQLFLQANGANKNFGRPALLLFVQAALLLLFVQACTPTSKPAIEQIIIENWTFAELAEQHYYPAQVPGTVHTDLFRNHLIPHPFEKCNEKELQWIAEKSWVYKTSFDVNQNILRSDHIALIFEGLDTYAEAWLNGHNILSANNMFRSWEVDCKNQLREKDNELEVVFHPAIEHYLTDSAASAIALPANKWIYSRKAAYHFGWDWGPTYITAGIWKPIKLMAWDKLRLTDWHIATTALDAGQANIELRVSFESDKKQKGKLSLSEKQSGKLIFAQNIEIEPGKPGIKAVFKVENPKLWWTNGLGEPYLYEWTAKIETHDGQVFTKDLVHGIRSLKLIQEDDSIGKSFYFELNGHPLFAKGVNYIPQHSFVTAVTDSSYRSLIGQAADANMNMIRIWGGGIYENDLFYELCDRHGILVWQDFMFACAMYPGNPAFIDNVRIEAEQQLKRLRNHSCIALWCGNNEVDEAWHNWGWQKQYTMSQASQDSIWKYYTTLFRNLLPEIVATLDPTRPYVSTSPQNGWGRKESMTTADSHYWGVWWGKLPFEQYLQKVPRFMSEFGFQALPSRYAINAYDLYEGDQVLSPGLKCHQKHPEGFQTIDLYLDREKLEPVNLDEYIYMSQLIQAQGIGLGIEAQHSAMPYCMGSLYWQLNDVWPVTSWSSIDSKGVWKALHYRAKELFAPVSLSILAEADSLKISVINDRQKPISGSLSLQSISFDGSPSKADARAIEVGANSVWQIKKNQNDLGLPQQTHNSLLAAKFVDSDGQSYSDYQFFAPYGSLKLLPSTIDTEIVETESGLNLHLKSAVFTAFVQLSIATEGAHFSDNFFHLFPGEEKSVSVKTKLSANDFKKQLNILTINNILNKR